MATVVATAVAAMTPGPPTLDRTFALTGPYDFRATLQVHKLGPLDPTARLTDDAIVKVLCTPEGPVTIAARHQAQTITARLNGPGTAWMAPHLEAFFGLHDAPFPEPPERDPTHALWLGARGLRLARTPLLHERHQGYILQQRVTFGEAARAWGALHRAHGEPAPGAPALVVPLDAERWRRVTAAEVGRLGVDLKRWSALQEAARAAPHLLAAGLDKARVSAVLDAIRGTGVWTRECVLGFGLGDADALPLGDVHLAPNVTKWFEGRPQASDDRMVELLEPYRPNRFRVVRWLVAPRYG